MRAIERRVSRWAAIVPIFLLLSGVTASPARAVDPVPYDDRDSNYLKVLYHFVYPVGRVAEIVFFRPLHTIASLSQPDPGARLTRESDVGRCVTFRPSRSCSRSE